MAEAPEIRVIVKDFRAVASADILINGITVVAGENGSGKSSISKLLYYLYKTVADYDAVIKRSLRGSLNKFFTFIEIINQDLRGVAPQQVVDFVRSQLKELNEEMDKEDFELNPVKFMALLEHVQAALYENINQQNIEPRKEQRIKRILRDILDTREEADEPLADSFKKLKQLISRNFADAVRMIGLRPTFVFESELQKLFTVNDLPKVFQVEEYGSPIVSLDSDTLAIPYNIKNAIYIDSPMMFHAGMSNNGYWEDLYELLGKKGDNVYRITEIISKEIIQGDIEVEEVYFTKDFKFKRNDGKVFNLMDVATGIKSFSIILQLLKNGSITDKTLLIIDEPESNLHPQWIIEYARIIVLLNKELGVKFFLATHNPDMVSAIRYISEKQGTLDKVNFYLAEKAEEKFKYNYTYLNKEIDPIFASFNIALDRINQYGI
ncbi:AAA family ATPase [Chitinophaga ginsengisoli]|uniref:Putative AbiEii toxin of type IV toxin-antitoxin system n=1 Tax=Chitinophaga ginsengisoli TaxID=363837 RepID=A0A2P8GKU4_9BACT|nr:AAA family ATPase [Chitinophaga ginsengisoli]PSL34570.1 putative AbiEii toxin of type IV toxin-antitoxin system [Chitinophaga ginsengisoli]